MRIYRCLGLGVCSVRHRSVKHKPRSARCPVRRVRQLERPHTDRRVIRNTRSRIVRLGIDLQLMRGRINQGIDTVEVRLRGSTQLSGARHIRITQRSPIHNLRIVEVDPALEKRHRTIRVGRIRVLHVQIEL